MSSISIDNRKAYYDYFVLDTLECGIKEDRDVHSAKNMIWLKNNVGVGRTNVKRVELEALLNTIFNTKATETMKHEANTL